MALSSIATSRLAFDHALDAGLLDEIWVDLVPVLLGKGERFFDQLKEVPFELEGTDVDVQGVASPTCVTGSTTRECGCGSLAAAPCRGRGDRRETALPSSNRTEPPSARTHPGLSGYLLRCPWGSMKMAE
jgi:hypothetical protein